MWPTHKNFTQALIVLEEVGAVSKPMPLHNERVIALSALLYGKHSSAESILSQVGSLSADNQNIAVLWE